MAQRKRKRKAKVVAFPENIHSICFNVTLFNQSQDDVLALYQKLEDFMVENFPVSAEVAYEINEVQRKGKKKA